jgi:hypothetical protein
MEIKTQNTYPIYLLEHAGYALFLPFLFFFIDTDMLLFAILIFLGILLYKLRGKFTKSLCINGPLLEVAYVKYFRKKNVHFKIADTVLILRKYDDLEMHGKHFRQISVHILDVVENKKVKHQLNIEDGYSMDTIMAFLHAFSDAKTMII